VKPAHHLSIKKSYLPVNGADCVTLLQRGETMAGIIAAMERPAWQK